MRGRTVILNAHAVLALFVAAVELALGVLVAWTAVRGARRRARDPSTALAADEAGIPLGMLLAFGLAGAALASWPLLYLLLDSYVPQWAGVMCVEGVTRIGTGSEGATGLLPALASALEVGKPALVFLSGAWIVLHLANRRTPSSPYAGRVLVALAATGVFAVADAAATVAWVAIPKRPQHLARGCCTTPEGPDLSAPASPAVPVGETAFLAGTALLAAGTWAAAAGRPAAARRRGFSGALLVGSALAVPFGAAFLCGGAVAAFLGPEAHPCAYCLLGASPVAVLGTVLFVAGAFGTAWASLARLLAPLGAEAGSVRRLRYGALFGWTGALLLMLVQATIS
jgi:hypothetical protein